VFTRTSMKSSIQQRFKKKARPEVAPEQDMNIKSTEPSEAKAKLIVRLPRQRELSLPVTLAKASEEARLNTLRYFGINE